jgi:hypothetical protein
LAAAVAAAVAAVVFCGVGSPVVAAAAVAVVLLLRPTVLAADLAQQLRAPRTLVSHSKLRLGALAQLALLVEAGAADVLAPRPQPTFKAALEQLEADGARLAALGRLHSVPAAQPAPPFAQEAAVAVLAAQYLATATSHGLHLAHV